MTQKKVKKNQRNWKSYPIISLIDFGFTFKKGRCDICTDRESIMDRKKCDSKSLYKRNSENKSQWQKKMSSKLGYF